MPKRTDIKSICIIGAGPIIIGQACEFDYSGAQACKALREEGYRVILINSNPATIMTDPDLADATYIEPITPAIVEQILRTEKPDALLPTMGGQTALNTAMDLDKRGILHDLGVELIGAKADVIDRAEDRIKFRDCMDQLGLESPKSAIARSLGQAEDALALVGLPAIIRPSFTLGGTGGGIAYNREEFERIVREGISASPVGEILIEESVLGWKEFEMEVVRDKNDNCIIVCSIENIDPMGVHTGDSITVAPALTLTDKEYQIMRDASIRVLRGIGVETGGSNVQFAIDPDTGRMVVIEMNPRVSRSSALASKATGFPIAKIAAKLAVGYTLDELRNDITGGRTPASFEPTIDYVVTKIPRFAFEKFSGAENTLTTAMKSVGEAMSIGRSFDESLHKALRSLEKGLSGFIPQPIAGTNDALRAALARPTPQRLLNVAEAFRRGLDVDDVYALTKIDRWFLERVRALVECEQAIRTHGLPSPSDAAGWMRLKTRGFSDRYLAQLTDRDEDSVRADRHQAGVHPVYKRIDSCGAEIPSSTAYLYSSYEPSALDDRAGSDETHPTARTKVIILGGGPNRIGQGIEFDYCCVHACYALKEAGYETIMINCNPETVSTDPDTSDRLYFEPLTTEDVIEIIRAEEKNGALLGVIVQLGGQTPLNLAKALENAGIRILGTSTDAIDLAEDRERFKKLLGDVKLRQPANALARSTEQALNAADQVGYPLVIRPSYVLGGQAMRIVHDREGLEKYMATAVRVSSETPVLLDAYLNDAIEIDVDALADGRDVYVAGILEHIEEAGIHSGDSTSVMPPHSLPFKTVREIEKATIALAKALAVKGLMNVQYALKRNAASGEFDLYVLEVNPRASRTVPFVAKATGVPIAKIAARLMAGDSLADFRDQLTGMRDDQTAVKAPVFPFNRFQGVDVLLGPEMKSTGEVMGIDRTVGLAFAKSQLGAGIVLPITGTAFLSVKDADKESIIPIARDLLSMGFTVIATRGTAHFLQQAGLNVGAINKVLEGQPHIVDALINRTVHLVINTAESPQAIADSFSIRRTALMNKIPCYTVLSAARAAVQGIHALREGDLQVRAIQDYFKAA